jgi:hypothetical protein
MYKKYQLINESTGEIVGEKSEHFTDSMNDEGYRFPSHKAGIRLFKGMPFPDEMTDAEIGKMLRLSMVVIGKTNMLGYRQGQTIEAYTSAEIVELAKLRNRQGKTFLNKMLRLRIMQRVTTNTGPQYYINPAYLQPPGHRLSLDLFLLFRDELTGLLPQWAIDEFLSQARFKQTSQRQLAEAERILQEG